MPALRPMVLSLALLAPLVSGCPSKQGPTPEELALIIDNKLEVAATMRLNNKLSDAEEIFKWVIEKDDTRAAAWYGLGEVRVGQDNEAEAGQLFKKAVELAPTDRAAQAALGRFLASSGDHDGAVKALAVAYGDALEDPKLALAYGISLRESGDLAKAEKILREVAEEDEYLEHVYTELGDLLRAQKRTDDALRAYLKAHYQWLPGMRELAAELQGAGVPLAAFSNYPAPCNGHGGGVGGTGGVNPTVNGGDQQNNRKMAGLTTPIMPVTTTTSITAPVTTTKTSRMTLVATTINPLRATTFKTLATTR